MTLFDKLSTKDVTFLLLLLLIPLRPILKEGHSSSIGIVSTPLFSRLPSLSLRHLTCKKRSSTKTRPRSRSVESICESSGRYSFTRATTAVGTLFTLLCCRSISIALHRCINTSNRLAGFLCTAIQELSAVLRKESPGAWPSTPRSTDSTSTATEV